jgi:hypothetical protein
MEGEAAERVAARKRVRAGIKSMGAVQIMFS